LFTPFTRNGR